MLRRSSLKISELAYLHARYQFIISLLRFSIRPAEAQKETIFAHYAFLNQSIAPTFKSIISIRAVAKTSMSIQLRIVPVNTHRIGQAPLAIEIILDTLFFLEPWIESLKDKREVLFSSLHLFRERKVQPVIPPL